MTKVQLWGGVAWSSGIANGTLRLLKNRVTFLGRGNISSASGVTDQGLTVVSAVILVVAGDYFEVQVYLSAARTVSANGAVFGLAVVETSDAANSTRLALTYTPASYVGATGKPLRVNAGDTGVEFGPRQNLTASAAPTATDDSAAGYGVGSCWLDTVAGKIWFCTDATAGAAVWKGATLT